MKQNDKPPKARKSNPKKVGRKPCGEKLTPKMQLFIEEYLVDLNAMQAAERAGYSKRCSRWHGSELMTKPPIAKAIQRKMDERAKRIALSADYVLTTIRETVERCKQAVPVTVYDRAEKKYVETGEYQFDSQAVLKGCELLGKHLKLFSDRVEHTGPNGGDIPVKISIEFVKPEEAKQS